MFVILRIKNADILALFDKHHYNKIKKLTFCERCRGSEIMKAVDIALHHQENISELVNITNRYPFTILLRQGRYLVDAKSVLGVCSLQRGMPMQLEIYSDDCHALLTELKPMIC